MEKEIGEGSSQDIGVLAQDWDKWRMFEGAKASQRLWNQIKITSIVHIVIIVNTFGIILSLRTGLFYYNLNWFIIKLPINKLT